MRLAFPRLAAAAAAVLLIAGCGGADVTVEEVPGAPVALTVPGNGDALAPDATPTPTATPTETPEADATETPSADTGGGTTQTTPQTPPADAGGGSTAPSTDDTATNDQPPPAGSDAEQFENFCAENPGAC